MNGTRLVSKVVARVEEICDEDLCSIWNGVSWCHTVSISACRDIDIAAELKHFTAHIDTFIVFSCRFRSAEVIALERGSEHNLT